MLIQDWMKKQVISVTPDMTLHECHRLLKRNNIHHLPVVNSFGIVIGLVTDIDIKRISPMNSTGLEIIEYLDLLDKTKVKEVMEPDPMTILKNDTIEHAAQLMISKNIGCLPVADQSGRLEGIITVKNVFRALLDLTGADQAGVEVGFNLPHQKGTLRAILDQIYGAGLRMISVQTSVLESDVRKVKIRFRSEDDPQAELDMIEKLEKHPDIRYWVRGDKHFYKITEKD
ncbi:MAG: CBS domain-containing protein [Mailhella sp.]|nr:CBS domain-containing protein [Mailhella sp.]